MGVIGLILLDTHVLAWTAEDPDRLSRAAASEIRRARRGGGLGISAITLWELSWQIARGRIRSYGTVDATLRQMIEGVAVLPVTPEIAALATQFPDDYPHDPADRLIGATARAEGMSLVTKDERIRKSPLVRTVW
jgi:PIN domain nuclease of toxin-antitoxin system